MDTYLRFAEAVNRLDLQAAGDSQGLQELVESVTSGGAKSKTQGAVEGVKETLGIGEDEEGDRDKDKEKSRSRRRRT